MLSLVSCLLNLWLLPRAGLGLLIGLILGFALFASPWAIGACGLACLLAGWRWERYDQQDASSRTSRHDDS